MLAEVQRLKAEASRMVKLLAQEMEEEEKDMSEDRYKYIYSGNQKLVKHDINYKYFFIILSKKFNCR